MGVCLMRLKKSFGSLKGAEFIGDGFWAALHYRCDFIDASVFGGEAF
jgi:hypothetical protein